MTSTAMPTVTFYNGQTAPAIGLGTWQSPRGQVGAAVKVAIDCGYRHLDCAWIYSNEAEIGEAIKTKIADGTVRREDLFVTTKLWNDQHRPDLVEGALRDSLGKLGLDFADMYLMHWPTAFMAEDEGGQRDSQGNWQFSDVDYIDTWKAMEQLVDKGLTRNIGVANFNSEQLGRILSMAGLVYKPAAIQVEVHPYMNNEKLMAYCKEREITVTAYSPLCNVGHPRAGPTHPRVFDEPALIEIGKKYGKSAAQVTLRWGLQRGSIVIPKSVTPSRIQENIQILDFELTQDDMNAIASLNRKFRACNFPIGYKHKYYPFNLDF